MSLPNHIDVARYMSSNSTINMNHLSTLVSKYPDYAPELCRFAFNTLLPEQRIVFVYLFKQLLDGGNDLKTSTITNALTVCRVTNKDIQSALKGLEIKGYASSRKVDGELYRSLSDGAHGVWLNYFRATYSPVIEEALEKPMIIDPIGAVVRR